MSFVYPRTIAVTRPNGPGGVGAVSYGALLPSAESAVASAVAASIQQIKAKRKLAQTLPGDAANAPQWRIFFNLPNGAVAERDVIVDDQGARYQIAAAYWTALGYQCLCERLEV
ncbi:MAG TPA: hypothetical protein DEP05_07965 [Betaproteobacteria bacterium]|nr:hypothetical protein [Betaproteobacteria bacterium]